MTFCTHCATIIPGSSVTCPSCGFDSGASHAGAAFQSIEPSPHNLPRVGFLRFLYVSPLLLLVAFAATFVHRETDHQASLAALYASAESAAAAGDLITARDAFTSLVDYRDSAARTTAIEQQLAPLEAAYADGLRAIERGEYEAAVASLEPVATRAPNLHDVTTRLQDAKRLLAGQLTRQVDAAETVRDWSSAEGTLRKLIALDPANLDARQRLGTMQRELGPLVLGRDRDLWLVSPDGGEEKQITDSLPVIWPAWSPDRSRIAFLAPDPDDPVEDVALYVVGLNGVAPRKVAASVSAHTAPSWSPDGSRIAYTSFAGYDPVYETGSIGVRVVDLATGLETDITGADFPLAFNPAWSPDGHELAFVVKNQEMDDRPQHSPGDVWLFTLGDDGFTNLTNGSLRHVWSVAWSPRGDTLLLYSLFGQAWYEPPSTMIHTFDRQTGALTQIATIAEQPTPPVWSPDGTRFAFTLEEKRIVVQELSRERRSATAPEALSGELSWSPDGQALILTPWNAEAKSVMADLSTGELALSPVDLEFDASPPFLSPPQWAPAVALPPQENPSLPFSAPGATPQP